MLINSLEGGRRVLLESGCSLTFLEWGGGSYSRIGAH